MLLASVLSALIAQALLGKHLVLEQSDYTLKTPLIELPLYWLLATLSGIMASLLSQKAQVSFRGIGWFVQSESKKLACQDAKLWETDCCAV